MSVPASASTDLRRILVVDDDAVTRLLISHHLIRHGFEVLPASSVQEAMAVSRRETVATLHAVVTDYLMPDGTGLELIEWLKKEDENIGAIVVTSLGERDLVKQSLRGGACDFLDKPVQIEALIQAVRGAMDHTERGRHLRATESSVREVGRFQQFMLGTGSGGMPAAVEVCWHPMHPVGGDLVNVIPLGPHRFLLLAADVSGHDLKAGFISAFFQGIVRGLVEKGTPIEEVFSYFNRFLISEWSRSQDSSLNSLSVAASISACAFLVEGEERKLAAFNSGFPIPLYTDPDGSEPCSREPGFPMGWFPDCPVVVSHRCFPRGGCVHIWTDGLEDLALRLGVDPMALATELIAARREGRVADCLQFANDDILFVRLNLEGAEAAEVSGSPLIYQELSSGQESLIDDFQTRWEKSLRLVLPGIPDDRLFDILLCAREAVLNAIRYGCDDAGDSRWVSSLQVSWHGDASLLRVVVRDRGPGHNFSWQTHLDPSGPGLPEGHRGLALIHQLPTATRIERDGALVTMDFSLLQP